MSCRSFVGSNTRFNCSPVCIPSYVTLHLSVFSTLEAVLTTLWLFSTKNVSIIQFKTWVKTSGFKNNEEWSALLLVQSGSREKGWGQKTQLVLILALGTSSHALALAETSWPPSASSLWQSFRHLLSHWVLLHGSHAVYRIFPLPACLTLFSLLPLPSSCTKGWPVRVSSSWDSLTWYTKLSKVGGEGWARF